MVVLLCGIIWVRKLLAQFLVFEPSLALSFAYMKMNHTFQCVVGRSSLLSEWKSLSDKGSFVVSMVVALAESPFVVSDVAVIHFRFILQYVTACDVLAFSWTNFLER